MCLAVCRVFTGFRIFRGLKVLNTTKHKLHTTKHKLHTTRHELHTTKHSLHTTRHTKHSLVAAQKALCLKHEVVFKHKVCV